MSRVKKDSLRVYPAGAVERVLVVQSVLNARKPPGAMLRYDGRLTTPSACLRIVQVLTAFSRFGCWRVNWGWKYFQLTTRDSRVQAMFRSEFSNSSISRARIFNWSCMAMANVLAALNPDLFKITNDSDRPARNSSSVQYGLLDSRSRLSLSTGVLSPVRS
jgi:hypothetical protein